MNATEAGKIEAKNRSEENAVRLLDQMLVDFAARFAPKHPRERDYFHTAMTTVVRQVTLDAHRVYGEQLTKHTSALMALAHPLIMVRRDVSDADLKPGSVVYQQKNEMFPLSFSVHETSGGVPYKWNAERLGFTYAVQMLAKTYAVSRDGQRIGNRATLELAQELAFDDCQSQVRAVLK